MEYFANLKWFEIADKKHLIQYASTLLELVKGFLLTLVGIFNIYPFSMQKFAVKSTCHNGFYYGCLIATVKPDIEEPLNFDCNLKRFLHNSWYLTRIKLKCFLTVSSEKQS